MKTEEEYKAEVLQLMRDLYPTLKGEEKERAEYLFPELKENGDERTKNEIIAFVEQSIHRGGGTIPSHPYCRRCLDRAKMQLLDNLCETTKKRK